MIHETVAAIKLKILIAIGAVCFNVAMKYAYADGTSFEDIYNYKCMIQYLHLQNVRTPQSMVEMEFKVVCDTGWNLSVPTVYSFIPFYIFVSEYKRYPMTSTANTTSTTPTPQVLLQVDESLVYKLNDPTHGQVPFDCFVHCLCERFLLEKHSFQLPFSQIAAFCIMLSRKILGRPIWSCNLEFYTKYKVESLSELEPSFIYSLYREVEYQILQKQIMKTNLRIEVINKQLKDINTTLSSPSLLLLLSSNTTTSTTNGPRKGAYYNLRSSSSPSESVAVNTNTTTASTNINNTNTTKTTVTTRSTRASTADHNSAANNTATANTRSNNTVISDEDSTRMSFEAINIHSNNDTNSNNNEDCTSSLSQQLLQLQLELLQLQQKLHQEKQILDANSRGMWSNIIFIDQALSAKYKQAYNVMMNYAVRQYQSYYRDDQAVVINNNSNSNK